MSDIFKTIPFLTNQMKDLQKGGKNLMQFVKVETMKKGPG